MTKIIMYWVLLSLNLKSLPSQLKDTWSKNYQRLTLFRYNQQNPLKDAVWLRDQILTLKKILNWLLTKEIAQFKLQITFWNNIKFLFHRTHLHTLLLSADPQSNRQIVFLKTSKLPPKFLLKSLLTYSIRFQGNKLSKITCLNLLPDHFSENKIML